MFYKIGNENSMIFLINKLFFYLSFHHYLIRKSIVTSHNYKLHSVIHIHNYKSSLSFFHSTLICLSYFFASIFHFSLLHFSLRYNIFFFITSSSIFLSFFFLSFFLINLGNSGLLFHSIQYQIHYICEALLVW